MSTDSLVTNRRFEPGIPKRIAIWLGIYGMAAYWQASGESVKPIWSGRLDSFYWYHVIHFPEHLQFLAVGTFGLHYLGFWSRLSLIVSCFFFLLDFALCFWLTRARSYWILIGVLVCLIFFSANDYYLAPGPSVNKAFSAWTSDPENGK